MANITGTSSQLPIGVLTSLLAFNIILSFTASLGNVLILLTIYKVSSLHPVTKLLFASLATTDLCVGLFSQPLFVASIILKIDLANTDLDILYHLSEVIYISSYVLCGVSLLISAAISVDRLLVLLLRLRYREVVTQKRAQVVILLCWVIAISCGLVRVWSPTVSEIVVFVAGFVSLVTSVICYAKIHQRLQRNQATREDNYGCEQSNEGEEVGGGEEGTGLTTGEGRAAGEEAEATTGADAVYYSGLQKTRWLASSYRAITTLEKYYVTTVMHLQHKTGSTGEDGARAKGILKQLLSERFVVCHITVVVAP
ncbi:melanocortin receptor 4-like [Pocillopora damicornis]|uniref:melanocortin receptor 4-like n=1 Tax=Pocillopora damicornis TaxID=46731 RepID=UPI000F554545|nr:melanocortin receptor 4-like [Pocillopora damicornis]